MGTNMRCTPKCSNSASRSCGPSYKVDRNDVLAQVVCIPMTRRRLYNICWRNVCISSGLGSRRKLTLSGTLSLISTSVSLMRVATSPIWPYARVLAATCNNSPNSIKMAPIPRKTIALLWRAPLVPSPHFLTPTQARDAFLRRCPPRRLLGLTHSRCTKPTSLGREIRGPNQREVHRQVQEGDL